jgi:hypothetical protein
MQSPAQSDAESSQSSFVLSPLPNLVERSRSHVFRRELFGRRRSVQARQWNLPRLLLDVWYRLPHVECETLVAATYVNPLAPNSGAAQNVSQSRQQDIDHAQATGAVSISTSGFSLPFFVTWQVGAEADEREVEYDWVREYNWEFRQQDLERNVFVLNFEEDQVSYLVSGCPSSLFPNTLDLVRSEIFLFSSLTA